MQIGSPRDDAEWTEYYDLRWRVLRAPWNQSRGSERDELDAVADHVSVRDAGGLLMGVGRLHLNSPTEAQIRYMAVEEALRGRGVGRAVVESLESIARRRDVQCIVLNARVAVQPFYERLGYGVVGVGPTMYGDVRHVQMRKRIS